MLMLNVDVHIRDRGFPLVVGVTSAHSALENVEVEYL